MLLVTDAIIQYKKKYIIVISGLDKEIVNDICFEMSQILKYTYLPYLDLDINKHIDDEKKNYDNIYLKIKTLIDVKPQGIILSLLSLPEKYNIFDVKLHINLSINQNYFNNIKKKYKIYIKNYNNYYINMEKYDI